MTSHFRAGPEPGGQDGWSRGSPDAEGKLGRRQRRHLPLQEAFALFDIDHNGKISLEELAEIMANHNLHPSR
jgi:hypothetical protein